MNVAFQRNVGSFVRAIAAFGTTAITTSNDGTAVNGLTIDRNAFVPLALSALVAVNVELTTIGDTDTVQLVLTAEDSADGSTWDDLDIGPPDGTRSVVYDDTHEDTVVCANFKAQLGAARRYVRFNITPTLSASSADGVSIVSGVAVLAGWDELPADDYVDPAAS